MKLLSVMKKSMKEQWRSFWILLLTVTMAPFFVFVYYLILESEKPHYDLLLLNNDESIATDHEYRNYGQSLIETAKQTDGQALDIPLSVKVIQSRAAGIKLLKNKKADALVVIPDNFSENVQHLINSKPGAYVEFEFVGDLTDYTYMLTALWAEEIINDAIHGITQTTRLVKIKETGLGVSSKVNEFDVFVPGLIILSVIMLMFTATIAIVTEVENKTILRLKLSRISSLQLLTGISLVQVVVGMIAVALTLLVALSLGFHVAGSWLLFVLIVVLASISIIAFSLILAAATKSANEVLIVGNFPMFLFMFFTGAAFPLEGKTLFTVAGYSISIQGLMSPTHAIAALKKIMIMNMGFTDILPELGVLIFVTIVYFVIGVWAFNKRHMTVV